MTWHPIPKDDAWKLAYMAMVEGLGKRLWLGCDACQHTVLLTLSRALRCTRCGERKGQARTEPHGYDTRR